MTLALFPLLAAVHVTEVATIVPVIAAGAAAVYYLLPRPQPYRWWIGPLLACLTVVLLIVWPTLLEAIRIFRGDSFSEASRFLVRSFGEGIRHIIGVVPETFLFYAFSVIAVVSGSLLVTQHNPARAALSFAVVILSTCGLFLLLAAPFLAAATIIIYAGAIIVTFLFVLMLAQQAGLSDADARSREPLLATLTGFILLGALVYVLQLSYVKNDGVTEALDQVLTRTRAAKNTADLKPETATLSATLTEPLVKLLPSGDNPSTPRLARLDSIRAFIENSLTNAKSSDDVKAALDQIERRVLYTQQQEGWLQPKIEPHAMSDLSGPSANERVENLRYDDQGRPAMPADNSAYLGRSLFTDYLLPVELGGFLLLVAVIGSIAIAQRRAPVGPLGETRMIGVPLHHYLVVGAILFCLGMIGFLARRNLIIMFLCAEMMLQGVAINLVAFARYRGNLQGQTFVLFIITVAACEAAIALALILMLFKRRDSLDVSLWQDLREEGQEPAIDEEPLPPPPPEKPDPHLTPAGPEPEHTHEEETTHV